MSYKAFVTRLTNIRPHSNADRLKLATVMGSQVVIGLGHEDGELGVFYPEGGALSHENCIANDLYTASAKLELNLPDMDGPTGFFDVKRRVRAQRFRGEKSEGIWLPISSLDWYSMMEFQAGVEIEDPKVAERYITPQQRRSQAGNKARSTRRGETVMFKKHADTAQFAYYGDRIPAGSLITLTEKLHGTSGRLTNALEKSPTRWYHRLLRMAPGASWEVLSGTRNVIIERSTGKGFYESENFRSEAVADILPRKGETIYFELVGYTDSGQEIMPSQAVPKELSELKATYGETAHFHYGCPVGVCRLYVCRITQTNIDGHSVELSWPQVKARSAELGLETVPELREPFFYNFGLEEQDLVLLTRVVNECTVGPSTLDATQIREGCALRIDTPDGRVYWLKSKSFEFKVLEGIIRLDDTHVDTEEIS